MQPVLRHTECRSDPVSQTPAPCARLAAEHDDPAALQEALIEEEKGHGPFAWIASKIPAGVHNNKIWRTIFWVRSPPCEAAAPGHAGQKQGLVAVLNLTHLRFMACMAEDEMLLCPCAASSVH
jgi:hypothetical protein